MNYINHNYNIKYLLLIFLIAFIFLIFEKGGLNTLAQISHGSNLDSPFLFSNNSKLYDDLLTINSGLPPSTTTFTIKEGYRIDPILWNLTLPSSVTFDKKGNRIGYGKGFYDRFLATCNSNIIKTGISIFEAEENIDADTHDIPMNFCVTPEKLYSF